MYYKSSKTARGNIGVSRVSQEEADAQAARMDKNNCVNCTNCRNCHNCNNCTDCNNCISCTDCTDCTNCRNCRNCTGCYSCLGVLVWRGGGVTNLLAVNGLRWSVAISQDRMQIGCQNHTHHEWDSFDDETITSMDSHALAFWQEHKAMLMSLCAMKAKEDTERRVMPGYNGE